MKKNESLEQVLAREEKRLQEEIDKLKEIEEVRLAREDPVYFTEYVMRDSTTMKKFKLKSFHKDMIRIMTEGDSHYVIKAFRNSGKTSNAVAACLYLMGKYPNIKIKFICADDKLAMKRIQEIRQYMLMSKELRRVYPRLAISPSVKDFSKTSITIERDIPSKEPTIEGIGATGSVTGGRADILILDDIENYRSTIAMPTLGKLIKQKFDEVWMNLLNPQGRIIMLCLHPDTLVEMSDGRYKKIKDIKEGEYVRNNSNGNSKVKKVLVRDDEKELYRFRVALGYSYVYIGKNHLIPVYRDNKIRLVKAKDVRLDDWFIYPKYKPPKITYYHHFLSLPNIYKLIGLFLIDGEIEDDSIILWFSRFDIMKGYMDRLSLDLAEFGRIERIEKRVTSFIFKGIKIRNKELATWLKSEFIQEEKKRLPSWIYSLNDLNILTILKYISHAYAVIRANNKISFRITHLSLDLLLDLQKLLASRFNALTGLSSNMGKDGRYYQLYGSDIKYLSTGRSPKKPHRYVKTSHKFIFKKVREIKKVRYEGKVYDLVLEGSPYFLLAGNYIVHNCTPWTTDCLCEQLPKREGFKLYKVAIDNIEMSPWPERWPKEELLKRKSVIGDRSFDRNYRLKPLAKTDTLFPLELVEKCINKNLSPHDPYFDDLPKYTGVDLASVVGKSSSSRTCIFTIASDGKVRYPIEIKIGQWTAPRTMEEIEDTFNRYHPEKILTENNSYQRTLIQWIEEKSNLAMPVEGFRTGSQKMDPRIGLPSLATEMENGYWVFPMGGREHPIGCSCPFCQWIGELLSYPVGKTDTVMAFWLAREALRMSQSNSDATSAVIEL